MILLNNNMFVTKVNLSNKITSNIFKMNQTRVFVFTKKGRTIYLVDKSIPHRDYNISKHKHIRVNLIVSKSNSITFGDLELNFISKCNCIYLITEFVVTNIPVNIKTIVLDDIFNKDLFPYLHPNIQNILFGQFFNQPVDNLPANIKNIQFSSEFSQPIDNLPNGIKRIQFGYNFNYPVDMLPESVEYIGFGNSFNHPVNNLPNGIKFIRFGQCFNQPIDMLPDSVTTIIFSPRSNFSYPIEKFPSNIKTIKFGWGFRENLINIPKTICKMILPLYYPTDKLKKLDVHNDIIKINLIAND